MDLIEDPLTPVIEEIAALLATGYLRLRMARTACEAADSRALQVAENSIYTTPMLSSRAPCVRRRVRKEANLEPHTPDGK
jgi:hypothetical protein